MVQCRWGFINENESLLTRLQSTFLNGHFIIEHTARNRSGHFFNFNGTAGIWRKEAIESSGGWHGDTLTEDLDLSYRAQLNKWKFVYLKDVVAPSELPPTLDAFNGQQFRWVKGMCEVLVKLIPNILRSKIPVRNKLDSIFNLMSCVGYISSVLISFSSVPVLLLAKNYIDARFMALAVTFIIINLFMIWLFYFCAELNVRGLKLRSFLYPALLVIFSIGFSLNGVYAIKQALLKKKTAFIRTPKFNNVIKKTVRSDNNSNPVYRAVAFFTVYFTVLTVYIVANEKFNILPALFFFAPSYFWLFIKIVREKIIFHTSKS
jgi:cellulose synthase/poly-beta-1,6-N-acetylglucosamine synthase-like glycosyltransferase